MAKKKPAPKKKTGGKSTKSTPKKKSAPDWGPVFLAHLSRTANILDSARVAGIDRKTAYKRRDSDDSFALAMTHALDDAIDELELEGRRRAHDGVRRVKFHQGQPIMIPVPGSDGRPLLDDNGEVILVPYVEHEYSDTLLIFLLKAHRPEKYRDRHEVKHSGAVATLTLEQALAADKELLEWEREHARPRSGSPGGA